MWSILIMKDAKLLHWKLRAVTMRDKRSDDKENHDWWQVTRSAETLWNGNAICQQEFYQGIHWTKISWEMQKQPLSRFHTNPRIIMAIPDHSKRHQWISSNSYSPCHSPDHSLAIILSWSILTSSDNPKISVTHRVFTTVTTYPIISNRPWPILTSNPLLPSIS